MKPVIAIDTEYDEVTKIPFICTMSDGENSVLLYPDKPKDYFIIKKICESKDIIKVFHAITADMYAFHQIGIKVIRPYHDTFIQSSIIDENFSSKNLKQLAKKYLHEPCEEAKHISKIIQKYKRKYGRTFSWSMIPKKDIEPYAVKDAEYTIDLYRYFKPKMEKYKKLYRLELDLIPLIMKMTIRGLYIDRNFCKAEMGKLDYIHRYYYRLLFKKYGKIFNLNSSIDIRKLIKTFKITVPEKTTTGQISTAKETLTPMIEKYPILRWILNCKNADKQISTYYWPLLHKYTTNKDPVAHFQFYQSGTKSGRFSAELIQTAPKEKQKGEIKNNIRRAFISRPGYVNLYFDYDQIEMRIFAHFTNNKTLIEAIKNGYDVHEAMGIELFGKEIYEDNPKDYRRIIKTINFGIIYGMGLNTLAKSLGVPKHKANEILSQYDQTFRVRSFIQKMTSLLLRQGYISLGWIDREYRVPKNLAYKSVNILIQGTAAYIIKKAMKIFSESPLQCVYKSLTLLLQMHDELIFEIHESELDKNLVLEIKNIMEDFNTFKVPITTSAEYSIKSWMHKMKWKFLENAA